MSKCIMGLAQCDMNVYLNFITITAVRVADDYQKVISHLNQISLSGYHFIKVLDRPVDLPLRFIVVRVAEPLTFKKETDISTKLDTVTSEL